MPWHVSESGCPASDPWAVVKDSDSSIEACHATEQGAKDHMAALYASEERQAEHTCECLDCDYEVETAEHCADMTCPECGGEMRRQERPGPGRGATMKIEEFWAKVQTYVKQEIIGRPERAMSLMRLDEMIWNELMSDPDRWLWPMGIYLDGDDVYAVVTEGGKLYRMAITIDGEQVSLGEMVQVAEVHQPVGRTVIRQIGEQYRWFSVSATAVINKWGEIDSRDLFDSFVAHAEETGEYPVRDFYHQGEAFRIGQADFLARDGNVLVTSGVYDDTDIARAEIQSRQADPEYWGDSIAFYAPDGPELVEVEEIEIPVYRAGVMQFISTVARADAASIHVRGNVQEVSRMLEGRAFEAFVKLFNDSEDEARTWLSDNVDETNRTIEAEGAITRSQPGASTRAADAETEPDEAEETPNPLPDMSEPEPVERVVELDDEAISALVERVTGSETFGDISASIEALSQEIAALVERLDALKTELTEADQATEERIGALERTDEEKEREWMEDIPRRETVRVTHRPREMNDPNRPDSMADTAAATLANTPGR